VIDKDAGAWVISFGWKCALCSEELQHRLRHAVSAATKERVQMLYWIKTQAIAKRQELSQRLGRDESTVYRWTSTAKARSRNPTKFFEFHLILKKVKKRDRKSYISLTVPNVKQVVSACRNSIMEED